jgi:hypothetical protein
MNWERRCGAGWSLVILLAAMIVLSCTDEKPVDPGPTDTTPPAAITDLNINCITSGSVELTWTAPGDDGIAGRATSYDIRYHTDQIDSVTWKVATACLAECVPSVAGTSESYTVTDLNPCTPYFFAIRAIDEASNRAGISNSAHTQTHDINIITWARTFGGPDQEAGGGYVVAAPDGGYVLGGETDSYGDSWSSFYFLKVDEYGNQVWHSWYGYPRANIPFAFAPTLDGGYIMAGEEGATSDFDEDILVVKVDGSGNLDWMRTYGINGWDMPDCAYCIVTAPDGGYIIGAEVTKQIWQGSEILMRIDDDGDVVWEKVLSAGSPNAGIPTPDGNFLIGGQSITTGGFWLLKVDGAGNTIWEKTIRHEVRPWVVESIALATGGGYVVTGRTSTYDAYVVGIDESGQVIWDATYGVHAKVVAHSICRAHCSGYIVAGWKALSDSTYADVWIFKIDESGNMLWERTYGGDLPSEGARSVAPTADGGYIIGAATWWPYSLDPADFWIIKVDDEGRLAE